jgi:hypothetical protein
MALSTKSSSKQPVAEKRVKGSRKVEVKVKVAPLEELKEEVKEEILEQVLEVLNVLEVLDVLEDLEPVLEEEEVKEEELVVSVTFEAGANGPAPPLESLLVEVECPPCEEQIEEHTEPIVLAKKCAKVRPQVNENGDYLNPITNRYVKFGSNNFKKLLQQGIIKPVELTGL